jgi:hypothetical protein
MRDTGDAMVSEKHSPMANWRLFIPFVYFFSTRIKTVEKAFSWLTIYPLSVMLAYATFTEQVRYTEVAALLISMIIIYAIYEIGYIANDTFTVEQEKNPTLRLSKGEISWVKRHWFKIIGARLTIATALLGAVSSLETSGFFQFCLSLLFMGITFYIYNQTRGIVNIPVHFVLVVCRFCGPCMLVMPDLMFLGFTILAFPLINLIERGAEPRYHVHWLQRLVFSNQRSGRWLYYLIASFLWLGFAIAMGIDIKTAALLVFLFVYRLISPLLSSRLRQHTME